MSGLYAPPRRSNKVKSAYLDGELCALNGDGRPNVQSPSAAMNEGRTDQLVFFAFDLLFLNGTSTAQLPLIKRKERLQRLFKKQIGGLRYSQHVAGDGRQFRAQACKLGLEAPSSSKRIGPTHQVTAGLGEIQMPQPRGVRCCRLDRS